MQVKKGYVKIKRVITITVKKKTKTVKAQVDKIKCEIKKPKILEGWIV